MQSTESTLLTVAEVAERLRCSRPLVYKLIRLGRLPCIRVGGAVRIDAHDLAAYLLESSRV